MKKRIMRNEVLQISLARKLLMVMKITFVLLLVGLMQVSASTYSQNTKLTLNLKNVKIAELFEEIEKNSEFRFFYDSSEIDLSKKVTVDMKKSNIEQILNVAFLETGLSYELIDRHIIVKNTRSNTSFGDISKAQQNAITGTVTDDSGQPLPGVTVVVKGTTQGTVTNPDGEYSLSGITSENTLVFSFVGMITQEIIIGKQTAINVTMEADAIGIEEVIAIGYGTIKKSDLTGAVSTVNLSEMKDRPIRDVGEAMQGNIPGVTVVNNGGSPDSESSIRIRGIGTLSNEAPLWVVDGSIASGPVNPSDIFSCPTANRITLIATIINIASEFIA